MERPESTELILGHKVTHTNTITGELVSQEYPQTCVYRQNGNPRSTDKKASRTDKPQSETARPANTRENQMAKGKCKNITNRNQGNIALSESSSLTTGNPGYPNTLEKQKQDLKSHFMMLIEDFKKDINTGEHGSIGRRP